MVGRCSATTKAEGQRRGGATQGAQEPATTRNNPDTDPDTGRRTNRPVEHNPEHRGGTTMATTRDRTRQLAHPADGLSVAQQNAVDALLAGLSDTEAAEAAGVTRQTVNAWKNHNPTVVAAMNQARRDLWERSADRLRGLVPKAIDMLEVALGSPVPDPKTALDVLRLAGLADRGAPLGTVGPATVARVVEGEVIRRRHEDDPLEAFLLPGGPITDAERRAVAAELLALGAGERIQGE